MREVFVDLRPDDFMEQLYMDSDGDVENAVGVFLAAWEGKVPSEGMVST